MMTDSENMMNMRFAQLRRDVRSEAELRHKRQANTRGRVLAQGMTSNAMNRRRRQNEIIFCTPLDHD